MESLFETVQFRWIYDSSNYSIIAVIYYKPTINCDRLGNCEMIEQSNLLTPTSNSSIVVQIVFMMQIDGLAFFGANSISS